MSDSGPVEPSDELRGERPSSSSLQLYLDGEGPEFLREEVARWIEHCPETRAEYERLQAISLGLRDLPVLTAPASLRDRVLSRIEERTREVAPPTTPASPLTTAAAGSRWSGALAATLLLGLMVGAWYGFEYWREHYQGSDKRVATTAVGEKSSPRSSTLSEPDRGEYAPGSAPPNFDEPTFDESALGKADSGDLRELDSAQLGSRDRPKPAAPNRRAPEVASGSAADEAKREVWRTRPLVPTDAGTRDEASSGAVASGSDTDGEVGQRAIPTYEFTVRVDPGDEAAIRTIEKALADLADNPTRASEVLRRYGLDTDHRADDEPARFEIVGESSVADLAPSLALLRSTARGYYGLEQSDRTNERALNSGTRARRVADGTESTRARGSDEARGSAKAKGSPDGGKSRRSRGSKKKTTGDETKATPSSTPSTEKEDRPAGATAQPDEARDASDGSSPALPKTGKVRIRVLILPPKPSEADSNEPGTKREL